MAVRAMWKGVIQLGDGVGVKLYAGVQDQGVHFRLLHAADGVPIRQHMVDPTTGKTIESDNVRKGFPVGPDTYVVLTEDELDELEPPASRDIEVLRFVPDGAIGHAWYDRPYFLGPDTDAEDAYFALAEALRKREVEAVVRWIMRKKEYVGSIRAHGDHIALMTLRRAGEVLPAAALEPPAGRAPTDREAKLAQQLLGALEDDFDPAAFTDEYRDRVLELIEAKASGGTIAAPAEEKRAAAPSLSRALEASVRSAKERKIA